MRLSAIYHILHFVEGVHLLSVWLLLLDRLSSTTTQQQLTWLDLKLQLLSQMLIKQEGDLSVKDQTVASKSLSIRIIY